MKFDVGYYENRSKCLLVSTDDLENIYDKFKGKKEILLWCNAEEPSSSDKSSKKRKREGELKDKIYQNLKKKHGEAYSVSQLRLWARMIHCATHDNYDKPPCVPMFSGSESKRPKRDSLSDVVTDGVAALCKALASQQPQPTQSVIGTSPSKSVDLRMKNLQQLHYTQQLFADKILTEEEYIEQKQNILDLLRKLS